MYLYYKSYEEKYKKYKKKYQILKSNIGCTLLNGGAKGTLLNGGDCDPLPNPEEEDLLTSQNLLDLCPEERITIQNKCYEVRSLYRWIITQNNNKLPGIEITITSEEKQRLIQAYNALPITNILTRDKLIQIYPNLQQETYINLINNGYTDIALDTFTEGTFGNNLLNLRNLFLCDNNIRELQSGVFNNLPRLEHLDLENNKIIKLQPGIFDNLLALKILDLENNRINILQSGTFNNLPKLIYLYLENNQINILQPNIFTNGTFNNNLTKLQFINLIDNKIRELQPNIYYGLSNNIQIRI